MSLTVSVGAVGVLTTGVDAATQARDVGPATVSNSTAAEDYTRPDLTSARLAAKLLGHRIEVTDLRTESTTTYANADGTTTLESASAPVREQVAGVWQNVDTTLERRPSGGFAPRVAKGSLVFSSGGSGPLIRLSVGGDSVVTNWPGSVPVPTVTGNTATYSNVIPGVNLVLSAGVASYELSIVLTRRPAGAASSFQLPLKTSGLTAAQLPDGHMQFVDAAHNVVFTSDTASMWDAKRDHVTGGPSRVVGLETSLSSGSGGPVLTVKPSAAFLNDPSVVYPVTLDPSSTWYEHAFAFISSGANANTSYYDNTISSHGAWGITRVGTNPADGTANRAMYNFNTGLPATARVTSATLSVEQTYATSCSGAAVNVWGVANFTGSPAPTWNSAPQRGSTIYSQLSAPGTGCSSIAPADVTGDITPLAQTWANAAAINGSVELTTAEGPTGNYKEFNGNYATVAVTYTTTPDTPSQLDMAPCDSACVGSPMVWTNSGTPTLYATGTDPGGGYMEMQFDVYQAATKVATYVTSSVVSGSEHQFTVPCCLTDGVQYQWRARAYNGSTWGPYSSWIPFTVDTTPPTAAAITSSFSSYTTATSGNFSWSSSAPDRAYYLYSLDGGDWAYVGAAGGSAATSVSNLGTGSHEFEVATFDVAGNETDSGYAFSIGPGVLSSPADQDRTQQSVYLTGYGPDGESWVTYEYRVGSSSATAFQPIPLAQNSAGVSPVTVTSTGASVTAWPSSSSTKLTWNMAATVGADGLVQVEACFSGTQSGGSQTCSPPSNVQLTTHAFAESDATEQVGPGTVALLTGDYAVNVTDVNVPSYKGSLTLGRTFTTLTPSTVPAAAGVFGPGWRAAFYGPNAGHADATFVDNSAKGYVTLVDPDGTEEIYNYNGSGYVGQNDTAARGSKIIKNSASQYTLTEADGTQTVYTNTGGVWGTTQVVEASNTPAATTTTYTLDSSGRVTQILAPVPAGVSCTSPTTTTGCRTVQFAYATTTTATASTFGDYAGELSAVSFTSYDPATSAMSTVQVARYTYDATGHLHQEWDPRISPNLVTAYSYDTNGRLSTITPPGLAATSLAYDAQGRIVAVSHPDPSGSTATSTVVYGVPWNGAGPVNLASSVTSGWGETTDVPVTATAVFPADHVPAASPTSSDWPYAQITYMDVNGRPVNTGVYGDGAWQVSASRFDGFGNTVWSIGAGNLDQAISPTATTDPAVAAMTTELTRANALATVNTYSADGTEMLSTLGPMHPVRLAAGTTVDARSHTTNTYDEGAPSTGGPYRLVTTSVSAAQTANLVDHDPVTTQTGYAALVSGDVSGWVLHKPTSVTTVMASGGNLVSRNRYNAAGQLIESRLPMATTDSTGAGNDAHTTVMTYYTASGSGACVSAALAGLVCSTGPAAQPTSGKPLPVTTTTYNMYDEPLAVSETAGSVVRTTTTGYDAAGRKTSAQVTVTPAGTDGADVPAQTFAYDAATGLATTTTDSGGGSVTTSYDTLGHVHTYTDATGGVTTYGYDIDGRVHTLADAKGTTTYAYDGTTGEHRGLLTSITDSAAGLFTGSYDADGSLASQTYPGGLVATYFADNTGARTQTQYAEGGTTWLDFTAARDGAGRIATVNNAAGAITGYVYDNAGRLTSASDNTGTSCVTRAYGLTPDSDRTSLATSSFAPTSGACTGTGTATTVTHAYDQADRITDTGYSYDDFGRTTTVPSADAGGQGAVALGYYTNDLVSTIAGSLNGQPATKAYALDPTDRVLSETTTLANVAGASAVGVGWNHSLAVGHGGSVWAWGRGDSGQLGNGGKVSSSSPVQVVGLSGVTQVSAGYSFSVALKSDGTVWAWGANSQGELGNGSTGWTTTPVQVAGLTGVVAIAAGAYSTLAVKSDGTVWAWGRNNYGQLGDGTTTDWHTPIQVPGLSNVVAVSGGGYTSAALTADGSVWMWGLNNYGQLGNATTTNTATPAKVSGVSGVVSLSAGYNHTLALTNSGAVFAWGYNGDGELGINSTTNSSTPVQVQGLTGITAVTAGQGHSLALTTAGTVYAWGYGGYGEMGTGTTTNCLVPVQVPGLTGVTALAAGQLQSLALAFGGAVFAWGGNTYGQIGNGTTTNAVTPVQVTGIGQPPVLTDHYANSTDSPTWTSTSDGGWTRNIAGLDGNIAAEVSYDLATNTSTTTLQLADLQGDIAATAGTTGTGLSATFTYDEFGSPTDPNTARYGWLGGKTRAQAGIGNLTLMGVRVYNPAAGRFLQTDPIPGGSCNPYDYTCQDPINSDDLTGQCPWCLVLGGVLDIGEVAALATPVGWVVVGGLTVYTGYEVERHMTQANQHGGGASAPHGDGGRRRAQLEPEIERLQDELNQLNRHGGSRKEKAKIATKIKHLRQEGDRAAKGENHHN